MWCDLHADIEEEFAALVVVDKEWFRSACVFRRVGRPKGRAEITKEKRRAYKATFRAKENAIIQTRRAARRAA